MKKIIGFGFLIILISYLLLLSKYLVIEEILGFYLFPILVVIIAASTLYWIIRIFQKISYKRFITNSLLVACALQILIVSLILWIVAPRYFSREQVITDIDYAIKIMEDVHPNLYAIISKDAFYFKTDSIKKALPLKVSDAQLCKTLGKIFSSIGDGHTGGGGDFLCKGISTLFRKTLPYKIDVKNDRLFVAKNYFYRNTIPVGSEIIAINGKPSRQCLSEVSKLFSYESISLRNNNLSYPIIWGMWNDYRSFEITYITPDTKTIRTITSSGGIISKFMSSSEYSGRDYSYKVLQGNIGYMEFNAFNNYGKFKTFLDSTFQSIKDNNVKNLIIDIRKNGGGHSELGDEFLQYIAKTDFMQFDSSLLKISNVLMKRGHLNFIDSSKRIVGTMVNDTTEAKLTKLRDNPYRYSGQLYLLIGGKTFSSACSFTSAFKCYHLGKIIGSETGGITVCFGDLYQFKLPNTKLGMSVSKRKYYHPCGIDNRRGVIPDYMVGNSFEDDKNGIDRVLKFTVDLIKQDKNNYVQ